MTYPRHASRHVLATVTNIVTAQLAILDWDDDTNLPFGPRFAAPVTFTDAPAIAADRLADGVGPGTVSITLGPELYPEEQELGGPSSRQDYPIFVDLFQPTYAACTALANDVRDTLLGRFPGTRRHISVVDQTDGDPIDGWTCELSDVEIVRPEVRLPVFWQVVKVTAEVYFPEVQY